MPCQGLGDRVKSALFGVLLKGKDRIKLARLMTLDPHESDLYVKLTLLVVIPYDERITKLAQGCKPRRSGSELLDSCLLIN